MDAPSAVRGEEGEHNALTEGSPLVRWLASPCVRDLDARVLAVLFAVWGGSDGSAQAGPSLVAKRMGKSAATIRCVVRRLIEEGVISKSGGTYHSPRYVLSKPPNPLRLHNGSSSDSQRDIPMERVDPLSQHNRSIRCPSTTDPLPPHDPLSQHNGSGSDSQQDVPAERVDPLSQHNGSGSDSQSNVQTEQVDPLSQHNTFRCPSATDHNSYIYKNSYQSESERNCAGTRTARAALIPEPPASRVLGPLPVLRPPDRPPHFGSSVTTRTDASGKIVSASLGGGSRRREAPAIPPGIWGAFEADYGISPPEHYARPPFPTLRALGVDEGDDAALASVIARAWAAVSHKRTRGKPSPRVQRSRVASYAEAARALNAEGVSPWVFLDFAWGAEQERTRMPPRLNTIASPRYIGRVIAKAHADLIQAQSVRLTVESPGVTACLDAWTSAYNALIRYRPVVEPQYRALMEKFVQPAQYKGMEAKAAEERRALDLRDRDAIDRGYWVWSNA